MAETMTDPISALRGTVLAALAAAHDGGGELEPGFERPPKAELGDFSTNAALLLAPLAGRPPRELAEELGAALTTALGDSVVKVEVAGPGFLNLFLADSWYREAAEAVLAARGSFGSGVAAGRARKVLLEFVSANPTGPVTVAAARHAAYGDSLARILEFAGHDVQREYYLNDAGGQIRLFGASIAARMTGEPIPDGGYEGAYVADIAARIAAEGADPGDAETLARRGVELMREMIASSLARFRVEFDRWSSERDLHEAGALDRAVELIREGGHSYESEGALWMRTTDFSDDKDRVLVKADGEPTYFAADVAYHRDKFERGGELLLNVLGADHHGYVARLEAIVAALGRPPEDFEVQILQLVNLLDGGERAQMAKRKGIFVTLDELLDDIGVDAARFFLVQRSHDTTLDLDLELARKRENENPVYYVQYAHARIARILERAGDPVDPDELVAGGEGLEPGEKALILRLLEFPGQIERAELRREPHTLAAYARDVAADFHAFYRDCPVIKAPEPLRSQRLELCEATKAVIATSLGLLGIEAPEAM